MKFVKSMNLDREQKENFEKFNELHKKIEGEWRRNQQCESKTDLQPFFAFSSAFLGVSYMANAIQRKITNTGPAESKKMAIVSFKEAIKELEKL